MGYTQKQKDEARSRFLDGQPWEKIVEVFATVPQVTEEQYDEAWKIYKIYPGEKHLLAALNAVLAMPVIAAHPADGMVSLKDVEKPLRAIADAREYSRSWTVDIYRSIRARLTKPEPTVTLTDAAEGQMLKVPASAVHKAKYLEAVTYTPEPVYQGDVFMCDLCGACVSDQDKHTAFHGRAVK